MDRSGGYGRTPRLRAARLDAPALRDLGIFHAQTDTHGNVVIPENRVRAALEHSHDAARMRRELDLSLGQAWDDELEPFRYAGAGAPVKWLHRVG